MSHQLFALSPLDGRYRDKLGHLALYFAESGLMRFRLKVEIEYLIALGEEPGVPEVKSFSKRDQKRLRSIYEDFDLKEAEKIKRIEGSTNHDVKAVEYYLRERLGSFLKPSVLEFIHFGLTSEDVNNLAYALLLKEALRFEYVPVIRDLVLFLATLSRQWRSVPMLSMTHGQSAVPTTVGKEFWIFHQRLSRQMDALKNTPLRGKLNGASGNWNAHKIAYPEVNWMSFSRSFVRGFGLEPNMITTQIESHDYMAELFDVMRRFNSIVLDLDRDCWLYISRGVFQQKVKKGEVGSSTMPHKVNPIDFENSEGNIGLANSMLSRLSELLPVSRMQRDLSDSTVQRSIGVAFGYSYLAIQSALKGLKKLGIHEERLRDELDSNWEVLAEPLQQVMRKCGVKNAYEKLKELTRGKRFGETEYRLFVERLQIPLPEKEKLLQLRPSDYTGFAEKLVGKL